MAVQKDIEQMLPLQMMEKPTTASSSSSRSTVDTDYDQEPRRCCSKRKKVKRPPPQPVVTPSSAIPHDHTANSLAQSFMTACESPSHLELVEEQKKETKQEVILKEAAAAPPKRKGLAPPGVEPSCGCVVAKGPQDQSVKKHYEKGGFLGAMGDMKTLYCHHITSKGEYGVHAAGDRTFATEEEIWEFLGKKCVGRFQYGGGKLTCGSLNKKDHDNTCNVHTCLFVKNNFACPIPPEALK